MSAYSNNAVTACLDHVRKVQAPWLLFDQLKHEAVTCWHAGLLQRLPEPGPDVLCCGAASSLLPKHGPGTALPLCDSASAPCMLMCNS